MYTIHGADCDHYPGDQIMSLLRSHGQFRVTGLYLAHAPGAIVAGDVPNVSYADYVLGWLDAIPAVGFSTALYCSQLVTDWAWRHTKIVWSFHIPAGTEHQKYDPDDLPHGIVDPGCVATQFRQNITLNGIPLSLIADSGGFDLNLRRIPDPSSLAVVEHFLVS